MKSILFIISSLGGGGTEKVLMTLLKYFDYKKFKVELCLINRTGVYVNEIPTEVKLTVLYENPLSFCSRVEYNLYSRIGVDCLERNRIRSKIAKHYDAIISFCEGRALKFHSYVTDCTNNNITWVHTDMFVNHYTVSTAFSEKHEKGAYNMMQTIVFVSDNVLKQFEKQFPEIKVRKQIILNPIERDLIAGYRNNALYSENATFTISCIGGLRKVKGFDRVVRLASYLKKENLRFQIKIIGEGDCRHELERLIDRERVGDSVSLLGFLNPPYRELACSDLLLNTSWAEGYPLVLCEAMCLGIPIVSTKTAGTTELLGNDEYGLLVEQDDTSIFLGVKCMMTDKKLREYYHDMALKRAQTFDVGAIMNQIYELVESTYCETP